MTPTGSIKALILSDGRPGHYHLAEGVVAALARLQPIEAMTLPIKRRKMVPTRFLRRFLTLLPDSPGALLKGGYGVDPGDVPKADLVISGGRETIPANIAIARGREIPNIFCGSLKAVAPEHFSVVVSSYERHEDMPRHIVSLKPSTIDPDRLGRPKSVPVYGPDAPPPRATLLIGGDSGLFKYRNSDWLRLLDFVEDVAAAWGTRWSVSTSPRSPAWIAGRLTDMAAAGGPVAHFLDYRSAGPGTLPELFAAADAVVCTEDSSTMLSEAVAARLPVVGVSPGRHSFKPEEAEYRLWMHDNDWCRFLPIADLTVGEFAKQLSEIRPMAENHLDGLARLLKARLPELHL